MNSQLQHCTEILTKYVETSEKTSSKSRKFELIRQTQLWLMEDSKLIKSKIKNLQQKEYQLSEQKVKQGQAKDLSS